MRPDYWGFAALLRRVLGQVLPVTVMAIAGSFEQHVGST